MDTRKRYVTWHFFVNALHAFRRFYRRYDIKKYNNKNTNTKCNIWSIIRIYFHSFSFVLKYFLLTLFLQIIKISNQHFSVFSIDFAESVLVFLHFSLHPVSFNLVLSLNCFHFVHMYDLSTPISLLSFTGLSLVNSLTFGYPILQGQGETFSV